MILNLKLVRVDFKYCDYLRKFDGRVAYNKNSKELRPFVGILFSIDKNIKDRSCNFKLLESVCEEYNKISVS